jgi:hypothetical protein
MDQPERRRRRLRPSSSAARSAAVPPATDSPADPAEGHARVPGPPIADTSGDGPSSGGPSVDGPSAGGSSAAGPPLPGPPHAGAGIDSAAGSAVTGAVADPAEDVGTADRLPRPVRGAYSRRPTSGAGAGGDEREAERGLRGLVGSGSSQVSVGAALRARDAARPTEEQLAEAEQNLPIVRRNWMPREDLPRNR